MRRFYSFSLPGFAAMLLCASCAQQQTINVADAVLTSGASMSQGRRAVVARFSHDDFIVMLVDFTWPNANEDGGIHFCEWKWYKGTTLVSRSTARHKFASTPYTLVTRRAAATLGSGHFHVDTIVDGTVVRTGTFDITG